jgi:peptidoglycan hydrolase-like protein with peptidoglycan-binding domain
VITASVGEGGRNLKGDVIAVQKSLKSKGLDPGAIDGVCGRRTIAAIKIFQSSFLSHPDGRVERNGTTWRRLHGSSGAGPTGRGAKLIDPVPRGSLGALNAGVAPVNNRLMLSLFGSPRESFSVDCQSVSETKLARNMTTTMCGPLHVQGLRPAIDSLRRILTAIQSEQRAVYAALGTAGMLCCRLQRGSSRAISNHSWGTAIDLKLNGVLDARGDGKIQYGLTLIAPIFNRHGWYWGAGFPMEDAMHFEGGRTLVETWKNQLI